MQDTASNTELLLQCPRPYEGETSRGTPGDAANYGSAFHEVLEATIHARSLEGIAAKWGVEDEEGLLKHAAEAHEKLRKWLAGANPWKITFRVLATEKPMASKILSVDPLRVASRACAFDAAMHHYDLRKGEFGGTVDLVAEDSATESFRLVLDYKSGNWGEFHTPSKLPQLLSLALQWKANAVAVLHAPQNSVVSIYAEDVSKAQLTTHAKERQRAMRRVGSGFLRPGPCCKYCPAREGCPANDGQLIARAASIVKVATGHGALAGAVDKGAFHMLKGEIEKLLRRSSEILKADVKGGEIITRPDGKVLVVEEREYETLSKSSVIAALGAKEGEKMIERLRKLGCVVKDTREELRAKGDG